MSISPSLLTEEDQRQFQASAWGLGPNATWPEIHKAALENGRGAIFFHIEDWKETLRRLYRPDLLD